MPWNIETMVKPVLRFIEIIAVVILGFIISISLRFTNNYPSLPHHLREPH